MTRRNEAEGRGSVRGGGSEEMMSERASERGECGRERVRGECGSERVTRKGGWFQGWKRGRERRNGYRRRQRQTSTETDALWGGRPSMTDVAARGFSYSAGAASSR
jgi:hypothetical protein